MFAKRLDADATKNDWKMRPMMKTTAVKADWSVLWGVGPSAKALEMAQ